MILGLILGGQNFNVIFSTSWNLNVYGCVGYVYGSVDNIWNLFQM